MTKYLIINADDFGLHPCISSGIEKAIKNGLVTSVSYIVNGSNTAVDINILKRRPEISVGIHLNITDGKPISNPNDLPFLLNTQGSFKGNHLKTITSLLLNKKNLSKVQAEFKAQIEKLLDYGIEITHLDSHGHIHALPLIFKLTVELAKQYKIKFIRCPAAITPSLFSLIKPQLLPINLLGKLNTLQSKESNIKYITNVLGCQYSGKINKARLSTLLNNVRPGINELVVHPGENSQTISKDLNWNYLWQDELTALLDVSMKSQLKNNNIKLTNFTNLSNKKKRAGFTTYPLL